MRPDGARPTIIGPDSGPEAPFPLRMKGEVISGFGRGSKEVYMPLSIFLSREERKNKRMDEPKERKKADRKAQLGIPTANIPVEGIPWIEDAQSGVYFGWSSILLPPTHPDLSPRPTSALLPASALDAGWRVYPMVMSIGYNPFYKNTVRSAEVHVLHQFGKDFYGSEMRVKIEGYIRPEYDYVSVESLVEDINMDIEVAKSSLEREGWRELGRDPWLWAAEGARE
ncbi:hypothetical protein B7494_g8320 [Chlorociboria aeruginascens]|nr:hypothetical protein B7494_g8320 [Chlorociboria aeruginascens]